MTVTAVDVHNPENRIDDARILAVYWRDDPKPSYPPSRSPTLTAMSECGNSTPRPSPTSATAPFR
jgi:hypothetical protein